ncbi:LysE family transporter [Flindersiella endophytica]
MLLFLVVDGLLVLTPGPDWLYVIARSLGRWSSGLVAVAGICTAYVAYTLLTATGLAAAVAAVPGVLPVLRYAGAAYLVFLAIGMLRKARARTEPRTAQVEQPTSLPRPPDLPDQPHPSEQGRPARVARVGEASAGTVFRQSMLTGLLNPKALLLFLSLLPQFADQAAALPVGGQLALLGLLHVLACAVGYGAVALTAGRIGRRVASSSRAGRVLPVVSAALLLAVAAVTVL